MVATVTHPSMRAKQWDAKFWLEYVRNNRFARYSGTSANAVFQYNETLTGRKGDTISCNLVGVPRGSPNTGATQLVGNEKAQFNYSHPTVVGIVRDAVVVDAMEEQASAIDIRNAARQGLRDMASDYLKLDQIAALDDRTAQGRMTDDQWDTANPSRILYGAVQGSGGGFAAGLAAATAVPSAAMIRQAKSIAKSSGAAIDAANARTNPTRIRPIKVLEDEEWFVLFCGSSTFEAFQGDATISQANREGWQRYGGAARSGGSGSNPLFRGGDIVYDGVIVREIPEIDDLADPAAGVRPAYLCGAQAVHVAWAERTKTTIRKEDDYGYQMGVGFQEIRGVDKIFWEADTATNLIQWGVVSIFHSLA